MMARFYYGLIGIAFIGVALLFNSLVLEYVGPIWWLVAMNLGNMFIGRAVLA